MVPKHRSWIKYIKNMAAFFKNIAISNLVKESTAFCMYEGIKNDNILHYWKLHAVPKTYDFFICKNRLSEAKSQLCKVPIPSQCTNWLN